jgi:Branched-chain amino acid ATP-binding cassette transporter
VQQLSLFRVRASHSSSPARAWCARWARVPVVDGMGLLQRVYCLELGEVIAEGTPDEVRHDPLVLAAYLGTDERAIARSGAVTGDTEVV